MEPIAILIIAGIGVIAFLTVIKAISKMLLISQPNEVIILSGRKRILEDGTLVGYRIIKGGRALRIPLLEKASRMSLETIPIELGVQNAYSKGGIPLAVDAIANIKIDSKEPYFGNAVERFLNRSEAEIQKIAKETLEGNLRGVLASLTPEEVNEDRMKFAEVLMEEADIDLQKLGIQLDTLKITNISDERGYLDSIGRMKSAEVVANAKKAEADKRAEAEEAEALASQRAETTKAKAKQEIDRAQIEAQQNVTIANAKANQLVEVENTNFKIKKVELEKETRKAEVERKSEAEQAEAIAVQNAETTRARAKQEMERATIEAQQNIQIAKAQADQMVEIEKTKLRIKKAELEKEAVIKEMEAKVAGQKAQVEFEQKLEEERIILQQKKLQADVIEPAKAKKEAEELLARGEAAHIIANGEAQLSVLKQNISAFSDQANAEKVYSLILLPQIVEQMTSTVKGINIDKITMIDSGSNNGDNGTFSRLINQIPGSVAQLLETVESVTGVNVLKNITEDHKD